MTVKQVAVASSVATMKTIQSAQRLHPAASSGEQQAAFRLNRAYDRHFPVIDLSPGAK